MAHRPTQRRNTAPPESNPSPSTVSAPAKAKHPKPTTTTFTATPFNYPRPNPDLITKPSRPNHSFMAQQFSSLNLGHNTNKTEHPPSPVDTRLQAKAMITSAIVDSSSKFSLLKRNTHSNAKLAPKLEKEGIGAKRSSREKPQKSKLHGLVKNEKKGYLVEDVVKIEKSRSHDVVEERDDDDVDKRSSLISVAPGGGRRTSLCGSQMDLGDVFAINGVKMVSADMPPFMQIHAVDCARKTFDSMEKFTSKALAFSLKKEFDGVYGPAWHCIVGSSFGSYVTHSVGGFLYFSMDQKLYILLFKTAVQKVN